MSGGTTPMACPNCGTLSPNLAKVNSIMATPGSETVALLLNTNEPPTEVEEGHIGKALAYAQSSLAGVETRVHGLEKLLEELRQERTFLKQTIDEHKAVLSPLRRMSTEILCEILFLSTNQRVSLDTTVGSWRTSKVCHRWRQIVLSSPRFWSSIGIHKNFKVPAHALSITHTLLCRSGDATLDIAFEVPRTNIGAWGPVIDLLASASLRWRAINLKGSFKMTNYLNQVKGLVPQLEELNLALIDATTSIQEEKWGLKFFSEAPQLRRVILLAYPSWNPNMPLDLAWPRVTHLETGEVDQALLDGIRTFTHLTSLSLHGLDAHPQTVSTGTIRLDHLRELHLHWCTHLLGHFTLPVLDALTFESGLCKELVMPLSQLLTRSGCRLTRLSLELPDGPVDDRTALSLYRLVPSVVDVELELKYGDDMESTFSLIKQLKYHQDDDVADIPLPKLEKLSIYLETSALHPSEFFEAIVSRTSKSLGDSQKITPLRSLEIRYKPLHKNTVVITLDNLDILRTLTS